MLNEKPCGRQPSQPCENTQGGTETLPSETECWQLLARSTSSRGRCLGHNSDERQTQGKVQCFFPPAQSQSAVSKRPSRLNCCKCWCAFQDSVRMRMRCERLHRIPRKVTVEQKWHLSLLSNTQPQGSLDSTVLYAGGWATTFFLHRRARLGELRGCLKNTFVTGLLGNARWPPFVTLSCFWKNTVLTRVLGIHT